MRKLLAICALPLALAANAQPLPPTQPPQPEQPKGQQQIEKICGCFNVDFRYAETFSPDAKYAFHNREHLQGLELAFPEEKSDKKIIIQHLLLSDDSTVIKHWREDWTYEDPILFTYAGDRRWAKHQLSPADITGKWTQSVWEVDDGPRYQGISEWITTDNKTFWESTVDAPLPRREYTKRNDYNIMHRGNRILMTDSGWKHEQDNEKIKQDETKRTLIAEEKGINDYKRVNDTECAIARAWWEKNRAFWQVVRMQWQTIINERSVLAVKNAVDGKRLYEYFDDLWEDWHKGKVNDADLKRKVNEILGKFLS